MIANNNALSTLSAQVAAQNPRLSPQEAAVVASREVSNYVTQQQLAAQNAIHAAVQSGTLTPQQASLINGYLPTPYVLPTNGGSISPVITTPGATVGEVGGSTPSSLSSAALGTAVPGIDDSAASGISGFRRSILNGNGQYVPVQSSVPVGGTGGDVGGDIGGDVSGVPETADSLALQGTAQVAAAAGQYNLNSSTAALAATEAEKGELQNQVQGVQTFWEARRLGRMERVAELGPQAGPEELAASQGRALDR